MLRVMTGVTTLDFSPRNEGKAQVGVGYYRNSEVGGVLLR